MTAKSKIALNADLPGQIPDNTQQQIKPEHVRKVVGDGYDSAWNVVDNPDLDNPPGTTKPYFFIGNQQLGYTINQTTNIPEYTVDGGASWIEIGKNIPAVAKSYPSTIDMIADQSEQEEGQVFFVTDNGFYYEYLGTTTGTIADYRIQSLGDIRNKELDITSRWTFSAGAIIEYIYAASSRIRARFRDVLNAVNYITLGNSVTGQNPFVSAADSVDANRGIDFRAKGTAKHNITGLYYNAQSTVERALSLLNGDLNADYEIKNGSILADVPDTNGVRLDDNDSWETDLYNFETCDREGPKGAISSDSDYWYYAIEDNTWIRINLTETGIPTLQQVLDRENVAIDTLIAILALNPVRTSSPETQAVLDGEGLIVAGDHTTEYGEKGIIYGVDFTTRLEFAEPENDEVFTIPNRTDTAAGLKDISQTIVRDYEKVSNALTTDEQLFTTAVTVTGDVVYRFELEGSCQATTSGSVILKLDGSSINGIDVPVNSTMYTAFVEVYIVSGVVHLMTRMLLGDTGFNFSTKAQVIETGIPQGAIVTISLHSSNDLVDGVVLRKRVVKKSYKT